MDFAPISVGILSMASTAIFYLRWMDGWANTHADAEMQTRRLQSDIQRASWLADLSFEGQDNDAELSPLLIARFSEGLFASPTTTRTAHPVDTAADLLSRLPSVKASKESVEVTQQPPSK